MDYDNPAAGGGGWGEADDQSDFTDSERSSKDKRDKILLGSSKKKDKEKKKEKEKETKYNQLGAESSNDEDDVKGSGKSKKKAFKIGLAKKDKKDKKEKETKDKDKDSETKEGKDSKKKEKKDKSKLKLRKSHKTDSDTDKTGNKSDTNNFPPIFGVPLEVAVDRNKCHDGIKLPVVVRECVDYIEAEGLTVEGIYRSSGVKSKITKLKAAYNSRQSVKLGSYEPAVVASLFKLFLRELPEPVLTTKLGAKFEEVSQMKVYSDRRDGLVRLLQELPECNRVLVQWVFVHMGHVIANERMNKMTLQNVSIVLSPTMRISHRVLNCIFEHHAALFSSVKLTRYIPPISGPRDISQLPDSPQAIELEMRKQESLLAELHAEMSSGLMVRGSQREEQLWEQQRIVTQLKRNLRHAKSAKITAPVEQDYEEELNFALQTPSAPTVNNLPTAIDTVKDESKDVTAVAPESSPEEAGDESKEHKVTVQIHRDQETSSVTPASGHVTVIQLNQVPSSTLAVSTPVTTSVVSPPITTTSTTTQLKVIPPPISTSSTKVMPSPPSTVPVMKSSSEKQIPPISDEIKPPSSKPQPMTEQDQVDSGNQSEMTEPALEMTQTSPNSTQQFAQQVVSFSSPILSTKAITGGSGTSQQQLQSKIPLLPPPPPSNKPKAGNRQVTSSRPPGPGLLPPENKLKSKSLPRGLPSDGTVFDSVDSSSDATEDNNNVKQKTSEEKDKNNQRDNLLVEELYLKFQYEELMTLKSELERKKRTERREISELHEEIATMQTLYQYRTYSVDSSEEESDNDQGDTKEQRVEKLKLLNRLSKEKKELEDKKLTLQTKLAEEREACLRLRVNIRLEQERIKRQKLSQFPGIGFGKLNLMD